jgi:uncharacterized protein DUF3373
MRLDHPFRTALGRPFLAAALFTLIAAPVGAAADEKKDEGKQDAATASATADEKKDEGKKDEGKKDDPRVDELEKKAAKDRVQFSGDLRVTGDSLHGDLAARYDGMALQKMIVDAMFYMGASGQMPLDRNSVNRYIAGHYGDYLYFRDNLSFDQIKTAMHSMPPEMTQALMSSMLPEAFVPKTSYNNDIMYTTRLRLNMDAEVMENVTFTGRLAMYKAWGDSTGVQVFNGQPNSFSLDGTNAGTPNSDILRVERAFFEWKNLFGSKAYISIGRRPSTGGPPLELRDNDLRGGTPAGHVINYQFDGITLGYNLNSLIEGSVFRFCYGVGFESGYGSADQLKSPADRLKDVHMGGINWDVYNGDTTHVQLTALGAFDVTDGFNGLLVMPVDPVTGAAVPAPMVMRYTPSANLGQIYLGNVVLQREESSLDWFVSGAVMATDPTNTTTPFGGLLSDPYDTPERHEAWSVYAGLRYPAARNTLFGAEFNHGSKYWFNFTQGSDDLLLSKLSTRGNAFEAYWIQEFATGLGRSRAQFRLSGLYYDFDYSGSGWHLGAPKSLSDTQILGFPTYKNGLDLRAALTVKF